MKKIRRIPLGGKLLLVAAAGAIACAGAGERYIVEENSPRAEIVIAEEPAPVVPVAAGELQRIIEKMSGANLPIVTVPSGEEGKASIYVGRSRYSEDLDLHEEDGRGSVNAVYAFLRDLGFRWYFPGEIGKVIPDHSSIALPDVGQMRSRIGEIRRDRARTAR